jgi:hypothetical protein
VDHRYQLTFGRCIKRKDAEMAYISMRWRPKIGYKLVMAGATPFSVKALKLQAL